jgi:hypothetical protein
MTSGSWKPVTAQELDRIISDGLLSCSANERAVFESHKVMPYSVPIVRLGKVETAFVIAEFGEHVLYYEDVEEGFEMTGLDAAGRIPIQGCNQYSLQMALQQATRGDAA